ncbi:hypothetical protein CHS0354_003280 [Potamilus streckersoni]|uniref:Uncharacterized protein n=1 Tax=Potamilus streckersoni TaxID=2493646 RepID=A0AAE0SVB3_9BIVA|nr:hypothetical protein CHS0354_003280 [Potamilus streckersoni]
MFTEPMCGYHLRMQGDPPGVMETPTFPLLAPDRPLQHQSCGTGQSPPSPQIPKCRLRHVPLPHVQQDSCRHQGFNMHVRGYQEGNSPHLQDAHLKSKIGEVIIKIGKAIAMGLLLSQAVFNRHRHGCHQRAPSGRVV